MPLLRRQGRQHKYRPVVTERVFVHESQYGDPSNRYCLPLVFVMEKVFIYGTLKRGFAFHEKGLAGAVFLGLYQTVKPYPLYIAKPFYGPMMLERPGEGLVVQGEVYEANEKRLLLIDGLEDIGKPGSFRSKILVETAGGGQRLEAVAYFKDESWLKPLHSDALSGYQDRRFIPPWDR